MLERPARAQAPIDQTWDLGDIYPSPAHWAEDMARVDDDIQALRAYQGRVGANAATLLACLQAHETLRVRLHRLRMYAYFAFAVDGGAPDTQALSARSDATAARVEAATSFVTTELAELAPDTLDGYLAREQGLAAYGALLDGTRRLREHLLAPPAEAALAALGESLQASHTIWQMATAVDMTCAPAGAEDGREAAVSIASYVGEQARSADSVVRRTAYASLAAGLDQHKATLATALATHITQNVALARLRGYASATEMILARQRVPATVYANVLDVVHDEIAPHMRRLMRLRARALGLQKLQRHDIEAPLDPAYTPLTTFAESAALIRDALRPMGDEYNAIVGAAFDDRWIDRADNAGKRSGAFCWPVYGVHPYVFTTWQDTLRGAFTLAHELGHAGHYELTMRRHPLSTVSLNELTLLLEAPSTANELILGQHLLDATADPRRRRWLILQLLGTFTHNMVTHLLEGHFERRLYALAEDGRPLTLSTIMETQGAVFERFYADTVAVDDGARLYWAQQPHFYMNLYPYTYAAGLAGGYMAVKAMREEGQPAVDRWLRLLARGNTRPPLDLLRDAGVDLESSEPLRHAVAYVGSLVDELEQGFES